MDYKNPASQKDTGFCVPGMPPSLSLIFFHTTFLPLLRKELRSCGEGHEQRLRPRADL